MGWMATLTSNKDISHDEVEAIVSNLPNSLKLCGGVFDPTFNDWGWNAAADIYVPKDNSLSIGGSYSISGHIAEPIVEYFKEQLKANGHIIDIDWSW